MQAQKMTQQQKDLADAEELNTLARECVEKTDYDASLAATLYAEKIKADGRLKARLLEPFFDSACRARIAQFCAQQRAAIVARFEARKDEGARRIRLLADSHAASLLDFPVGAKPLRLCTKDEITAKAGEYHETGSDMMRKCRWLRMVAAKMNKEELAGERFTAHEVEALFVEASGDE